MNFLTGLGDLAGGFAPYLSQYADQRKEDSISRDIGAAAMQQAGVPIPPQQQGGLAGLLSGLSGQSGMGSLMALPPAQQQAMPRQAPPTAPQSAPAPMQVPTGNARSPLAPTQPMVAQPGGGLPSPQPAQAPGGGTAALQAQQSLGARQPPQQQTHPQGQEPGSGQFSPQQLIGSLMRLPNMTPEHVGAALGSKQFERLLNMEGLQQWRAMRGALGIDQAERGWAGLQERGDQATQRDRERQADRERAIKEAKLNRRYREADRELSDASQQAMFGPGTPDAKAAAYAAAKKKHADAIEALQKEEDALEAQPQDGGGGGSTSAGGVSMQEALQQAKAAITAGKPRDKIIERLKQHFPDADTSGL